MLRAILVALVDGLFAVQRYAYKMAVESWTQRAIDPASPRGRRAVHWTRITLIGAVAIAILWIVLANLVHW